MNEHDVIVSERVELISPLPGSDDARHLLLFRVFLVVAVVVAAIGGTGWYFRRQRETAAEAASTNSWFAPYVDVTPQGGPVAAVGRRGRRATPMIGQNDIQDEVFGFADADQLVAFAQRNQLRRPRSRPAPTPPPGTRP